MGLVWVCGEVWGCGWSGGGYMGLRLGLVWGWGGSAAVVRSCGWSGGGVYGCRLGLFLGWVGRR